MTADTLAAPVPPNHRIGARLIDAIAAPRVATATIATLVFAHVVAWTTILSILKSGQDLHSDSTEAYAWGLSFAWGYGKHPPLAGWIAGAWFRVFPTTDWAMYALAMTTTGAAIWIAWLLARRVVDSRRAMLSTLVLCVYPIFNFKGAKFNPDLLQVPLFLLVALCFVKSFKTRTWGSAIGLGTACAFAVLAKYWALSIVGAIAMAAVVHPDRARFFGSPVPYVAAVVFALVLTPHVAWFVHADYSTLAYASQWIEPNQDNGVQALWSIMHHVALLSPVALAVALSLAPFRAHLPVRSSGGDAALLIWMVAAILIVVPPILALAFNVRMKSDWGIPLYTLVPLAAVSALPLQVRRRAPVRAAAIGAVMAVGAFVLAPAIVAVERRLYPERFRGDAKELAATLTGLWHDRFSTPLRFVVGRADPAADIAFYSADHPMLFTEATRSLGSWIDGDDLRRFGFTGICLAADQTCRDEVSALGVPLSLISISQQVPGAGTELGSQLVTKMPGPAWQVFVADPFRTAGPQPSP
jgi:4-amino-4-deoxy-L-arabinose transferase-like glycosyltransferase